MQEQKNYKVFLTYKDLEGQFKLESIWAEKEGDCYRVKNAPFFAPNLAYNDLISVEEDDGELHFLDLVTASGHSNLQVVLFDKQYFIELEELIEREGCSWEGAHVETYFSVDVPRDVNYQSLRRQLDIGVQQNQWDFKEACLSDDHQGKT